MKALMQSRRPLPFYAYSSFNKKGGRTHAFVSRTRNRVLDLWADMGDYGTIADECDISISTVASYIRRARRLGDPRVTRPFRDRKIALAERRRKQITELASQGFRPSEIASRLGCNVRLVLIRLKEMSDA